MELIDKSALVAEIERIMDEENENINSFEQHRNTSEKQRYNTRMALLEHILSFLNTLETKEVDLNYIKKELDELIRIHKPNGVFGWGTLYNVATHFFELGLKTKKEE